MACRTLCHDNCLPFTYQRYCGFRKKFGKIKVCQEKKTLCCHKPDFLGTITSEIKSGLWHHVTTTDTTDGKYETRRQSMTLRKAVSPAREHTSLKNSRICPSGSHSEIALQQETNKTQSKRLHPGRATATQYGMKRYWLMA